MTDFNVPICVFSRWHSNLKLVDSVEDVSWFIGSQSITNALHIRSTVVEIYVKRLNNLIGTIYISIPGHDVIRNNELHSLTINKNDPTNLIIQSTVSAYYCKIPHFNDMKVVTSVDARRINPIGSTVTSIDFHPFSSTHVGFISHNGQGDIVFALYDCKLGSVESLTRLNSNSIQTTYTPPTSSFAWGASTSEVKTESGGLWASFSVLCCLPDETILTICPILPSRCDLPSSAVHDLNKLHTSLMQKQSNIKSIDNHCGIQQERKQSPLANATTTSKPEINNTKNDDNIDPHIPHPKGVLVKLPESDSEEVQDSVSHAKVVSFDESSNESEVELPNSIINSISRNLPLLAPAHISETTHISSHCDSSTLNTSSSSVQQEKLILKWLVAFIIPLGNVSSPHNPYHKLDISKASVSGLPQPVARVSRLSHAVSASMTSVSCAVALISSPMADMFAFAVANRQGIVRTYLSPDDISPLLSPLLHSPTPPPAFSSEGLERFSKDVINLRLAPDDLSADLPVSLTSLSATANHASVLLATAPSLCCALTFNWSLSSSSSVSIMPLLDLGDQVKFQGVRIAGIHVPAAAQANVTFSIHHLPCRDDSCARLSTSTSLVSLPPPVSKGTTANSSASPSVSPTHMHGDVRSILLKLGDPISPPMLSPSEYPAPPKLAGADEEQYVKTVLSLLATKEAPAIQALSDRACILKSIVEALKPKVDKLVAAAHSCLADPSQLKMASEEQKTKMAQIIRRNEILKARVETVQARLDERALEIQLDQFSDAISGVFRPEISALWKDVEKRANLLGIPGGLHRGGLFSEEILRAIEIEKQSWTEIKQRVAEISIKILENDC